MKSNVIELLLALNFVGFMSNTSIIGFMRINVFMILTCIFFSSIIDTAVIYPG